MVSLVMLLSGVYEQHVEQMVGLSILVMLVVFCFAGISVRQRFWPGIWLGCWQVLLQQGIVMLLGATSAVIYMLLFKLVEYQESLDPTRYL
jgi:branched-subunit amino acid transport protein AzlD